MKRLLVVAVAALSSCQADKVPPGRYACDPAGNREVGSAQCPGQSRCGLEGYCHQVGEPARWRCVTAADCELEWQCGVGVDGVSRECHDPDAPEDFRCATSADCSGGWTCGLDGARLRRCHDPLAPRDWPCDSTADCVGGWQCGIAATGGRECHDPQNPRGWVCLSNADCLGGWQCGLNDARTGRECHDPSAPRAFACEAATDCLAGWSCGLNDTRTARECHDPSAPRAFACEVASDCLGSWSCGLNDARTARECHDPSAPRAFACLVDADCVAGWDCGLASNRLQRECHDPQNPQAWACEGDADCLGGWRCDTRGLCVDPRNDALLPTGALDAGDAALINAPQAGSITRAAISPASALNPPAVIAVDRGATLEALSVNVGNGSVRTWDLGPSRGGPLLVQSPRSVDYLPSGGGRYVEVNANRVYTGQADGGLLAFLLDDDGGVVTKVVRNEGGGFEVTTPVTQLRHGVAPAGLLPVLVGYSESPAGGFMLVEGPGAAVDLTYPSAIRARPNNRITDLVHVITRDGGLECVLALDEAGVWARQFMTNNSWNFEQVHTPTFGNDSCAPVGLKVTRLESASLTHVLVRASPRDGGPEQVAVWSLTPMLTRGTGEFDSYCTSILDQACTPQDAIPFSVELGPCEPCPVGALEGVTAVAAPGTPELEVRCSGGDAGVPSFFRIARRALTSSACERRPLVGLGSVFSASGLRSAEQATLGRFVLFNQSGNLWSGTNLVSTTSVSFDRAATGVAMFGNDPREVLVIADGLTGLPAQRFGLLSLPSGAVTAVASNEPSWVLSGGTLTDLSAGPSLATASAFGLLVNVPATPHLVRRAVAATGATVAVVSGGGAVLAAEVDAALARQVPFVQFSPRTTAPTPFVDLAFPTRAVADAGVYLEGYGVSMSGVSRVVAETPTRWSLRGVPLPPALQAQGVWYEGTR
ncbi:MAG: hypothetical protein IAE78_03160, partial [Myxococcus sp.]|nr:hypothetical protein [Myxococcus sp.]